jgi:hypothetical protein
MKKSGKRLVELVAVEADLKNTNRGAFSFFRANR